MKKENFLHISAKLKLWLHYVDYAFVFAIVVIPPQMSEAPREVGQRKSSRDTEIQGLPCAGGHSVVYFPSGRVRLAWLSRQTGIGGVSCAPGIVYLHENGRLLNAKLAALHEFTGIVVPVGERVTLGEEGELLEHSRRLEVDQPIGGLLCSAEFHVWLYPGGQPSLAVLAESSWIGGRKYPQGSELFLDDTGQVLNFWEVDLDSGRQYKQRVFGVYEAPFE